MTNTEVLTNNSCRICNCPTGETDSVALFSDSDGYKTLTSSGCLFEELIGINIHQIAKHYPNQICNGCDLQMKLFRQLKEKALKTLKYFESQSNIVQTIEDTKQIEVITQENDYGNETISESAKLKDLEINEGEIMAIEENLDYSNFFLSEHIADDCECNEDLTAKSDRTNNMYILDYEEDVSSNLEFQSSTNKTVEENLEEDSNFERLDILTDTIEYASSNDFSEINYQTIDFIENEELDNEVYEKNNNNKQNFNETDKTFKCKDCSKEFKSIRLLKGHRNQHHPNTHCCTLCSKTFRTSESLEVHMKQQHLGLPAYSCDLCNRTFKQKVHYQYHMKRHNNERNYKCNECSKAFVSKSDLGSHMRSHSDFRPFACMFENCGKKFYSEQHLKMHSYYHMGEKVFECHICSRKFVSPTVLQTHLRSIHTSEKRFKCSECGNKFRRKHHLEAHLNSHQKNSKQNDDFLAFENINNDYETSDENDIEYNDLTFNTNTSTKEVEDLVEIQENVDIIINYDDDEDFIQATIETCSETDADEELNEDINYFEVL